MNIDIRTLAFIMGLTGILQVIAIYLQYLLSKTYQGIGWWLLWSASTAAGLLSLLLRDIVPVGLISASIFLSNILLLAGQIFLYIGITRFLDKKENLGIIIAVFTVFILSTFYVLYVNKDDNARALILYAAAAIFAFLAAQGLFVNKTRSFAASANFISAILFAYGCYFALRAIAAVTVSHVDSVFTPTLIQIATFLVMLTTGFLCTLGLIIMVSQRSNAEMREAKEQFELIFNTGPDATLITRPKDGLIVNINEGFTALTGYTRDETVGKSSLAINLWKDPADRQNVVNELGKKGFCDNYEAFFQLKDGSQIDGTMSAKIITLQGVQHIISVTRDITARKRAEGALRDSEEKFRALAEQSTDVVYITDSKGVITYLSPSARTVFGYEPDEMTGRHFMEFLAPDSVEKALASFANAFSSAISSQYIEMNMLRKDGSTFIGERNGILLRLTDFSGTAGIIRDITERKQMEDKLKKSFEELQSSNAELERFTYTISHDLKSPIVTIKTFLGYLKQDMTGADARKVAEDMLFMEGAADKMSSLLDELLEMSRIGRVVNPPVTVTFGELVQEALDLVAGGIRERGVAVQVSAEALSLYGDRPRLVEIWQNLLENAVKFMGGQASPRIDIGFEQRASDTVFFVRDNGMGIDPRYKSRVFNLFDKLDAKAEGTGLGLAIVRRIVELYKGTAWFESAGAGQGSCFFFTLPAALENEPPH
jgi:PAS domain S-box-containing protein